MIRTMTLVLLVVIIGGVVLVHSVNKEYVSLKYGVASLSVVRRIVCLLAQSVLFTLCGFESEFADCLGVTTS